MKLTSITTRITAIFALLSTVVMIAIGTLANHAVSEHFAEEDLTDLNGKLELIQNVLEKTVSQSGLGMLDDALVGHHALSVLVYTPAGKALYAFRGPEFPEPVLSSTPVAYGKQLPQLRKWQIEGKVYRGVTTQMQTAIPEIPQVNIAIAVDIAHHEHFISRLQQSLWLYLLTGILLLVFIGWFAARRGLVPILDFVRVAGRISASRLNERMDVQCLPVELVGLGNSFNGMLQRLQDAFTRLSDFSSDIAHELRTPVSNLMTQGHVALSQARTAEEYREVLYSNIEEYERLSRMIGDMLFLAKADNGLIVPNREPMDLGKELDAVIDFYEAVASDNEVSVSRSGTASIQGDRLMMRRVFSNLLSNAIRYTPKGMMITINVRQTDNAVVISFDNPGKPIPPEALARIFDRFYRIDPSRQRETEGTGLGLAITKSILEAHGGRIRAESLEDRVRFEIALPP